MEPLTPAPDHVPPEGVPVRVIGEVFVHRGPYEPVLTEGGADTTMLTWSELDAQGELAIVHWNT